MALNSMFLAAVFAYGLIALMSGLAALTYGSYLQAKGRTAEGLNIFTIVLACVVLFPAGGLMLYAGRHG